MVCALVSWRRPILRRQLDVRFSGLAPDSRQHEPRGILLLALEAWLAGRNTPQKLVWRARIVLMWADGAGITW
jgi:hypothetical protein